MKGGPSGWVWALPPKKKVSKEGRGEADKGEDSGEEVPEEVKSWNGEGF